MSTLTEIEAALNILYKGGCKKNNVNLLHCISEYPAPKEIVNLNFITTLKKNFGVNVGYSDHTMGIEIPIAAVALGANIIEKHFTLDRGMEGPDHKASLEPIELKEMVKSIRSIDLALGSGVKDISLIEKENAKIVRKSLVAINEIKIGDLFTEENVGIKRPGTGISPMRLEEVLGQKATKSFGIDQIIELDYE